MRSIVNLLFPNGVYPGALLGSRTLLREFLIGGVEREDERSGRFPIISGNEFHQSRNMRKEGLLTN